AIDQAPALKPVENGGDRGLAQADPARDGADLDLPQIADGLHDQQLRRGQAHRLTELARMQVGCANDPAQGDQYFFKFAHEFGIPEQYEPRLKRRDYTLCARETSTVAPTSGACALSAGPSAGLSTGTSTGDDWA